MMEDLINRFEGIQKSEPSNVKLSRLHSFREDLSKMFHDTFIFNQQKSIIDMKVKVDEEIGKTVLELDRIEIRRLVSKNS